MGTNLSILHLKKQISAGDPCRPMTFPNGKGLEDTGQTGSCFMVIIIVLTSSFARKFAKEQTFPLFTRLWYLAMATLCTWTRNKIKWETGCRRWPLEQWFKQTQRTAKGRGLLASALFLLPSGCFINGLEVNTSTHPPASDVKNQVKSEGEQGSFIHLYSRMNEKQRLFIHQMQAWTNRNWEWSQWNKTCSDSNGSYITAKKEYIFGKKVFLYKEEPCLLFTLNKIVRKLGLWSKR